MFVEASVPARANLFGNPLDIYGGLVISSSVARRATVSAQSSNALRFAFGEQECVVGDPSDLIDRRDSFDFLRALVRSLDAVPDCEIRVATDIPVRSGLGGSAALMLAASACVLSIAGKPASKQEILRTAYRAEVEFLNNFCGWNDFYACILGGVHEMNYRNPVDGNPEVTSLALPDGDVCFAVALTGDMHRSGAVNSKLWDRWRAGDAVVKTEYERLAELGPSARAAFQAGDWSALGHLMWQNFMCQYRLEAANEIEASIVREAMNLGAFGAKLSGAGHCGSIVVLARSIDHPRIHRGLEQVGVQEYFEIAPAEGLIVQRG